MSKKKKARMPSQQISKPTAARIRRQLQVLSVPANTNFVVTAQNTDMTMAAPIPMTPQQSLDDVREELEHLRNFKAAAERVLESINLSECGRLLGLDPHQSVAERILPAIKKLTDREHPGVLPDSYVEKLKYAVDSNDSEKFFLKQKVAQLEQRNFDLTKEVGEMRHPWYLSPVFLIVLNIIFFSVGILIAR